ncbi:hypothetical protein INS49_000041 [Diaporthe citri]|uniref:uncharacterized protein n=1 Tax=Diaporthe citri TaxID=83186 RepID=UPI001C80081F|nr:uncharacterized protein INS49_000041 [Diaporthe citri]KAG6365865.1 hypothetical protein INS49_000041 [Diaporthe citri]
MDSSSWQGFTTIVVVLLGSLVFHRLFLHPLAKYPGPKLAAITRWYECYYDVIQNGQNTFKIKELHEEYGPIIRISPHELHLNDPYFYSTLYRQEGRWNRYAFAWDAWGAKGPTIHTVDHDRQRARRQPIASYFAKTKVSSRQAMVQRHVDKLCDRLTKSAGSDEIVDLGAAVTALARDVAFDFILAKSTNSLDQKDFDVDILQVVQGGGALWRLSKHVRFVLPLLNSIPLDWAIKISDDKMKDFFRHLNRTMAYTERLMAGSASTSLEARGQQTIIHEILDSQLNPHDKSLQRVFEDVTSVSGAGFETTGSVLRLLSFHVFDRPEIIQRLFGELDSAGLSRSNVIELKPLEQLPFLTSTIKEGLRLSPGVATRMARIAPDRDLFYKDWRIPAGTPIGMTRVLMHTDENIYPNPQFFEPERWMEGSGIRKNAEHAYAPFSKGTRMCVGMHLAWAELYLALAALVQLSTFEFIGAKAEDFECNSDQFVIGTKGKGVLKAHVRLRGK